jgi:hypothetical protein
MEQERDICAAHGCMIAAEPRITKSDPLKPSISCTWRRHPTIAGQRTLFTRLIGPRVRHKIAKSDRS